MRFKIADIIRHRNGLALFRVMSRNLDLGMYQLRCMEDNSPHMFAGSLVDSMFIRVSPPELTMDVSSLPLRFNLTPEYCPSYASVPSPIPPLLKVESPTHPPAISPSTDVAVSLPGLPRGYYLKAFRKAWPGEMILSTIGIVQRCKSPQGKPTLYHPILGRLSDFDKSCELGIPGIPEGWSVVAYRKPRQGEHCIRLGSREVFMCKDDVWASHNHYVIVEKTPAITPCDGTLPGLPSGYKLRCFGKVHEGRYYVDTVGNLKSGPAKNRLVLDRIEPPAPVHDEVVTEYETEVGGVSFWTSSQIPKVPTGRTGRTRKVVVQ